MKARKRVVTSTDRVVGKPAKASRRTPTVRKVRSAIVAVPRSPGRPTTSQPSTISAAAVAPPSATAHDPVVDLSVDLAPRHGGLVLRNPMVAASGPFGYGVEVRDALDLGRLGGLVTRGTTLRPRTGNPTPRIAAAPGGLLNAVGLHDPGIDAIEQRYADQWANWPVPVIVNVAAASVGDFVELARRLDGLPGVAGIELDLSCPNAARGGLLFALDADAAAKVTAAVRRATDLPLLVKLSAAATDVRPIARGIIDAGADALSAVNTLPGLAVAADRGGPLFGSTYGGLSGPAIRPIALRVVYEVAQVADVPVVAMGGVTALADALDFLAVGAVAVGVATAALADPGLPVRLADELGDECRRRGFTSYRPLVGTALPDRQVAPAAQGAEYRP